MGLSLGSASIAQERESGTLATLLAQPISRAEVLAGKYAGLGLALSAALALGFGLAGLAVALAGGALGADRYAALVGLAVVLALAMLSVGLTISTLSRRSSTANGVALFAWLCFVFGGDLGLMGSSAAMHFDIQALFLAAAANPLDAFKIAAVSAITGGLDTLGPAGNYAVRTFGAWLQPLLLGVLAAWIAVPLAVAAVAFERWAVR
jgi:Cu-processing system permease protein